MDLELDGNHDEMVFDTETNDFVIKRSIQKGDQNDEQRGGSITGYD